MFCLGDSFCLLGDYGGVRSGLGPEIEEGKPEGRAYGAASAGSCCERGCSETISLRSKRPVCAADTPPSRRTN